MTVARRRAADRARREATLARKLPQLIVGPHEPDEPMPHDDGDDLPDERLRLICTLCHPALAPASRVALTLRYAAGLTTAEIARLFHTTEPTMAARPTRAKRKIAAAGIPYRVPGTADLPERLAGVRDVVYLVFTEGHGPTRGTAVVRTALCAEAIRLGRLLAELLPGDDETEGLLALMLLTHARSAARTDAQGNVVLLADQDRRRWDAALLAEGLERLPQSAGPFALQARIAAEHTAATTDWPRIAQLYAELEATRPVPAVRLNRAIATAEAYGPRAGLELLEGLDATLGRAHGLHLARAELLLRAGDRDAAATAFARAEATTTNDAVRAHLGRRRETIS